MSRTRHLHNNLSPIALDDENLRDVRRQLRQAILDGVTGIETWTNQTTAPDQSIYVGTAGVGAMYDRLRIQAAALNLQDEFPDFRQLAERQLQQGLPDVPRSRDVRPGCLSPIDSSVGLATLRVIHTLHNSQDGLDSADIDILEHAIHVLEKDNTRTNELLYGKGGLLFALVQLRGVLGADNPNERLVNLTSDRTLRFIVDAIIHDGTSAASSQELPLHFEWLGTCYLGAVHGLAGILTILLQCPLHFIDRHRTVILKSVNYLVQIVVENGGILPTSLPTTHHRAHPLVQICHGSPGILLLLATLDRMHPDWLAEVENVQLATSLATDVVWKQGILVKGISVCHGVTGNAWPWLLMAHPETKLTTDHGKDALSRALAFLLHSTEMPPMSRQESSPYRMPDNPYSLFEGLAGAICSWSEACVLISSMLGESPTAPLLGIPCIGGVGITGLL